MGEVKGEKREIGVLMLMVESDPIQERFLRCFFFGVFVVIENLRAVGTFLPPPLLPERLRRITPPPFQQRSGLANVCRAVGFAAESCDT